MPIGMPALGFNRLLFLFFGLLAFHVGKGQQIKGVVKSKTDGFLAGASVILYEADSTSMVGFDVTRDGGRWAIEVKKPKGKVLQVSYLGYEPTTVVLDEFLLQEDSLIIELKGYAVPLREVTVEAKRLSIVVSGDTVNYDASAFKAEGDQTLGDVLKRMPGIEVTKEGEINYNGKKVDKLLVEGLDILSDQHKFTTEGFQAEDIKGVQIIDQYRPFHEQYLAQFSNKVAMNILLTDEAKKQINGDTEILAGYREAYSGAANLYRVNDRMGITTFARSNNIGEPVITVGDFISLQGNFMQALNKTRGDFSQLLPAGFSRSADVQKSLENVFLTNLEIKRNSQGKLRLAMMGNFAQRSSSSQMERVYNQSGERITGSQERETGFPFFYAKLDNQRLLRRKKGRFSLEVPIYLDLSSQNKHYAGEIALKNAERAFENKQNTFRIAPFFFFNRVLPNNNYLSLQISAHAEAYRYHIKWTSDSLLAGGESTRITQNKKNFSGSLNSELRFEREWETGLRFGVLATLNGDMTDQETVSAENPYFSRMVRYRNFSLTPQSFLHFRDKYWILEAKLAYQFIWSWLGNENTGNALISPSFMARYSFRPTHFLLMDFSIKQQENNPELAFGVYEYKDENIIRHASLFPGSYARFRNVTATHFWLEREKMLRITTILHYNESSNLAIENNYIENGVVVQDYVLADLQTSWGLQSLFSLQLKKNKIRLSMNNSLSTSASSDQEIGEIGFLSANHRTSIGYQITDNLEMTYAFGLNYRQRNFEGAITNNSTASNEFTTVFTWKGLRFESAVSFSKFKHLDLYNTFTTFDAKVEYRLKRLWAIKITGKDLLNLTPRVIYSSVFLPTYFETSSYRRFPGYVVAGVKKLF